MSLIAVLVLSWAVALIVVVALCAAAARAEVRSRRTSYRSRADSAGPPEAKAVRFAADA